MQRRKYLQRALCVSTSCICVLGVQQELSKCARVHSNEMKDLPMQPDAQLHPT
jgi:hypothetical protein